MADTVAEHGSEDPNRRDFIHIAAAAGAVGAAGMLAWPLVDQMNPAGDTLALASIEFDLSKVQEGTQVVVKWRGKPVFVRYRTAKEIAEAVAADNAPDLKDPAKDADRHLKDKPQWLILVGVCTHLGCVPNFGGPEGGWLCPCHGSQYDTAGRIRRGPAPRNLDIPDGLVALSDTKIRIG